MASDLKRVGILYPGYAAEGDFELLNRRLAGAAAFDVVHTSIREDTPGLLEEFLAGGGFPPVAVRTRGFVTATEVGTLSGDDAGALVAAADRPDADAVLVPDTALHTIEAIEALEQAAGKPVLTANQVSAWEGLRLAGADPMPQGPGQLFGALASRS